MSTRYEDARAVGAASGAEEKQRFRTPDYSPTPVAIYAGEDGWDTLILGRPNGDIDIVRIRSRVVDAARRRLPHAIPFPRSKILQFKAEKRHA
jgi:hypothetical protein